MSETISTPRSGELLDIVDEDGNPTGQVASKKIIHDLGLPHRDTHVWVTNGRSLLQQQRNWDKSIMPGAWDISVGGHVGVGETYAEAAQRETAEELGLIVPQNKLRRIGIVATQLQFPGWKAPHNIVGDNYVLYMPDLQLDDLTLQEEEVQDARWYPIDQLEADIADPERAGLHAPQPAALYALGIAGMRDVIEL